MSTENIDRLLNALPAILTAGIALYIALRKTPTEVVKTQAETHKTEAETDNIHAQVADRWAEHVKELQENVRVLQINEKNLSLDISQVRRENETYRIELSQRDQIIADLKDWAERLLRQLRKHAPAVEPEKYVSHSLKTKPSTHLEDKA